MMRPLLFAAGIALFLDLPMLAGFWLVLAAVFGDVK